MYAKRKGCNMQKNRAAAILLPLLTRLKGQGKGHPVWGALLFVLLAYTGVNTKLFAQFPYIPISFNVNTLIKTADKITGK